MIWKAGNNLAWYLTVCILSSLPKKTEFMIYRIVGWQKYSETRKKNIKIEKYFFVIWGHCFKATVLIHIRTFVFL